MTFFSAAIFGMRGGDEMKAYDKKEWITPEVVVHGTIAQITKGGTGWKTNGTEDDLVANSLTPFQSSVR